jgi:predicted membrane channel-forming protein YqfA (hemolysin III family)
MGEVQVRVKKHKYNEFSSIFILITTTTTTTTSLFVSKCHDFYLSYLTVVILIPLLVLLDDGTNTLSYFPFC